MLRTTCKHVNSHAHRFSIIGEQKGPEKGKLGQNARFGENDHLSPLSLDRKLIKL